MANARRKVQLTTKLEITLEVAEPTLTIVLTKTPCLVYVSHDHVSLRGELWILQIGPELVHTVPKTPHATIHAATTQCRRDLRESQLCRPG